MTGHALSLVIERSNRESLLPPDRHQIEAQSPVPETTETAREPTVAVYSRIARAGRVGLRPPKTIGSIGGL